MSLSDSGLRIRQGLEIPARASEEDVFLIPSACCESVDPTYALGPSHTMLLMWACPNKASLGLPENAERNARYMRLPSTRIWRLAAIPSSKPSGGFAHRFSHAALSCPPGRDSMNLDTGTRGRGEDSIVRAEIWPTQIFGRHSGLIECACIWYPHWEGGVPVAAFWAYARIIGCWFG